MQASFAADRGFQLTMASGSDPSPGLVDDACTDPRTRCCRRWSD